MPSISADSYIRLSLEQLQALRLEHLISDIDADHPPHADGEATAIAISGYTEWATAEAPRVSLGWDWELAPHDGSLRPRRLGLPRGNVMLVDAAGADLGPAASAAALARLVDQMAWQRAAWDDVSARNPA
ncbi:DUF4902 domain-containing protein [Oxalobacteraceae bacterium OTU3REALA1]|nr:DUF4902 domain-containing protein [Oxalobacteraceae bacterium OTU3REALA1]